MNEPRVMIFDGAQGAWASVASFLPRLGMFLVILLAGYFLAKWLGKLSNALLERLGFDRLVERGGLKRVLERRNCDASDVMAKIVAYTAFLFVLQLAFSVFGPNPISDLINRVILFLPSLLVAILIIVVASAIAKAVKEIAEVALGNLSYGPFLASAVGATIVAIGVFAALSHLQIAPAIVNGLFYALLAIVAGSAIIAIGGGGIQPMRAQWEKALRRMEEEAPRMKSAAQNAPAVTEQKAEAWVKPPTEPPPRHPYAPKP